MLRLPLMALYLAVMGISVQSHVGGHTVGSDRASRSDGLSDEPVQGGLGQVRDRTQADASQLKRRSNSNKVFGKSSLMTPNATSWGWWRQVNIPYEL